MATPPFSISTTTPGDSDIVSQFPLNERQVRDIIQSWLLVNHDTNGNHTKLTMTWLGSAPATPSASLIQVYADSVGRLRIIFPDGTSGFVGIPPGTVLHGAYSALPNGYLLSDGSAVSRSTYADLFTAIGTLYGAGDGSTTFNLPDIKGRVIAGEDSSQVRLTSAALGAVPNLGAVGGVSARGLIRSDLPNVAPTFFGQAGAINVNSTTGGWAASLSAIPVQGGSTYNVNAIGSQGVVVSTGTFTPTGTIQDINGGVGQTATPLVQPTIILKAIIKT